MTRFLLRNNFWLLPLLSAAPLTAQWGPPVIALHLKVGSGTDQIGVTDSPDIEALGGVDQNGNIVMIDPGKNRLLIYAADGTLIRVVSAPAEVKAAKLYWPDQVLVHPTGKKMMVKSGENKYCLFSYDDSTNHCFFDPRTSGHESFSEYFTQKYFILKQFENCYQIAFNGKHSTAPVKCPSEPEKWTEIDGHSRLLISGTEFNPKDMAKPDGWHYVLVNRQIAVGQCGDDKCSYAAYRPDGNRIATLKLPFNEWRFAESPGGDIYSVRQFKKSDVIIYKRAWLGPGAPKTAMQSATPRPMYYDRELVFEDLDGRTMRDLDLLRNTIYARAGNPFRKKWLHDYFTALPWYKPLEKMDEKQLAELDKKNARMIMEYSLDLSEADLKDTAEKLQQRALKESLSSDEKIEVRLLSIRLGKWYGSEKDKGEYQPNPLENPDRLDQPVTLEDLSDFSRRDLRLLRNTVYARRGKPFTSETLGGYFSDMAWYHPDPKYHDKRLNGVDKQNIAMIISLERTLGGPMSEKEARGELSLEGA